MAGSFLVCQLDFGKLRQADSGDFILDEKSKPRFVLMSEETCRREAEELAKNALEKQVYIFQAIEVIEARRPEFVCKTVTPEGEIVPKRGN